MEEFTTIDRFEIHELAARYGTSIDDRDWDGLEDVFCRDAVYELRGFGESDQRIVGSAAIRRMMEASQAHPVAHHVTNVIVTVDGDEVRMRSKVIGSGARAVWDPPTTTTSCGARMERGGSPSGW